jgi:hypothetical protein
VYELRPAEPESVPSSANFAVIVVPGSGLASASPVWIDVASQSPAGEAAS